MNPQILEFAKKHKGKIIGRVLEVGSYNVNGELRSILPITIGVDMREGPGVDRVVDAVELLEEFGAQSFDSVVSADALEHMRDWEASLLNMWGVLKDGGVMLLTMANVKKRRHAYPDDYWRWPASDFLRLFGHNRILDWFEAGPSQGVVVVKSAALNLEIRPRAVPP